MDGRTDEVIYRVGSHATLKKSSLSNQQKWEVVPMGISLGGSIATNLAVKHNSTALALISSVDSIREEIKANLKVRLMFR